MTEKAGWDESPRNIYDDLKKMIVKVQSEVGLTLTELPRPFVYAMLVSDDNVDSVKTEFPKPSKTQDI